MRFCNFSLVFFLLRICYVIPTIIIIIKIKQAIKHKSKLQVKSVHTRTHTHTLAHYRRTESTWHNAQIVVVLRSVRHNIKMKVLFFFLPLPLPTFTHCQKYVRRCQTFMTYSIAHVTAIFVALFCLCPALALRVLPSLGNFSHKAQIVLSG